MRFTSATRISMPVFLFLKAFAHFAADRLVGLLSNSTQAGSRRLCPTRTVLTIVPRASGN